jgi:acetyltransferase-like isoleucine patch superfamily enzyme
LAPYGGSIELGDNIFIGPHCVIYGHGGLRIGSNTMIAAHTIIIPANHNFSDPDRLIQDQGETRRGITIEDDCWIGSGVRICDGVTLGRGTVVGAGSVVTKSLPAGIIAVGVPARQIKSRRTKS